MVFNLLLPIIFLKEIQIEYNILDGMLPKQEFVHK